MELEDKEVMCIGCDTLHETTPEESWHQDRFGATVFGVNVADYTYVIDMFQGQGPGPVCKSHTRDEISTVKEKEFNFSV